MQEHQLDIGPRGHLYGVSLSHKHNVRGGWHGAHADTELGGECGRLHLVPQVSSRQDVKSTDSAVHGPIDGASQQRGQGMVPAAEHHADLERGLLLCVQPDRKRVLQN